MYDFHKTYQQEPAKNRIIPQFSANRKNQRNLLILLIRDSDKRKLQNAPQLIDYQQKFVGFTLKQPTRTRKNQKHPAVFQQTEKLA
jgi:phosphoribosyl-dephospho-CoA transferase